MQNILSAWVVNNPGLYKVTATRVQANEFLSIYVNRVRKGYTDDPGVHEINVTYDLADGDLVESTGTLEFVRS